MECDDYFDYRTHMLCNRSATAAPTRDVRAPTSQASTQSLHDAIPALAGPKTRLSLGLTACFALNYPALWYDGRFDFDELVTVENYVATDFKKLPETADYKGSYAFISLGLSLIHI